MDAQSGLRDKNVLIVGGTSGTGQAAAMQGRDAGAKVAVVGFERDHTRQVASQYGFEGWSDAGVFRSETIAEAAAGLLNVNLRRHTARFSAMADVSGRTGNFRRRAELAPTVSNRRSENG